MGKKLLTLLLAFSSICVFAQTRDGSFRGTVIEEATGEPLPTVSVVVKDNAGGIITGGTTDFDGKFNINPVKPGTYNIEVSFMGFATINLNGVQISPNAPTIQDFKMKEATQTLVEVDIVYEAPMIDKAKTSKVIGAEDIVNMAVRDVTSVASQAAGVTTNANGETNIRGARDEGTVYFIDGVKVRGATNIPQAAIQQTEVITGGLPAQYGDAIGGVISTTTKGPTGNFFGTAEILTSTPFELISEETFGDIDYNLGALTLGGPLYKNKKDEAIVGFLFSSEFTFSKDRPSAVPYLKLDEATLQDLEGNPYLVGPGGASPVYRSEYITEESINEVSSRPNASDVNVRLNGNVQIKTSDKTSVSLGGRLTYANNKRQDNIQNLFNYNNNLRQINTDWSAYARFQQRFGAKSDENSLIKNAYYNIQVDYTRNTSEIFDEEHGTNFFRYGHVGAFDVQQLALYIPGGDSIYQNGDSVYVNGLVYAGDQPINVGFTQGKYNKVRGNYVQNYYDLAAENPNLSTQSIDELLGQSLPINGYNPNRVYGSSPTVGMWGAPGAQHTFNTLGVTQANYFKSQNSQFRVTAATNFDIKDHSLIVGFEYEQRSDRSYALNAVGLWQRMRQLQNIAITELDLSNPIYAPGVVDTIKYNRLYAEDNASTFSSNLRTELGYDPKGLDWLNIDAMDPDLFSLDMFSANELINPGGTQYVGYYGYDYTGELLSTQPTLADFFSETDENGVKTRPVGAFQPIYLAGYVQDQFTFNDLTFNVGVRVDRFDLNQQVLKDPYVLYPVYTVSDIGSTLLADKVNAVPSSIGGDYVVYVSSDDYTSANIVGYRDPDGNQWYDANGDPLADPTQLAAAAGGSILPFLKDPDAATPSGSAPELTAESFKDYEPQTVIMPRVAFNFPISDEALFIAHYDVLAQRPSPGVSRMDPFDVLNLANSRAPGILNNPDLRPQKTTEYEIGFKQTLSDKTAIKISAFYRELRDLIQSVAFTQAYPITYVAYGNLDFGTVKGFTLEYEMRRTNNVKLDANYTLQFADGTGSSATTGANLANSGQPNLRYILPLNFDNRHQFLVRLDYRYAGGSRYNGPVWWDKRVFENAGINITMNALSGVPYTKRTAPYAVTSTSIPAYSRIDGEINGARQPWTMTFDVRVNRIFSPFEDKKKSLEVYVQILNAFNTLNVANVYAFTGQADDDGYLASASVAGQVSEQAYTDLYNRRMANPGNYALPRRVRLGLVYNF